MYEFWNIPFYIIFNMQLNYYDVEILISSKEKFAVLVLFLLRSLYSCFYTLKN